MEREIFVRKERFKRETCVLEISSHNYDFID